MRNNMETNRRKNDFGNIVKNTEKKWKMNTRDIQISQWREKHKKDIELIIALSNKFNK